MRERLQDPHKAAAMTYAGLGVLVILITFVARLVPPGQVSAIPGLVIGAVFVLIFAALIYRGWWPLSVMLLFSNSWRFFTYLNDGRGVHLELLPYSVTSIEAQPAAFVNAFLMGIIVIMLARSAWLGFTGWRQRRQAVEVA